MSKAAGERQEMSEETARHEGTGWERRCREGRLGIELESEEDILLPSQQGSKSFSESGMWAENHGEA